MVFREGQALGILGAPFRIARHLVFASWVHTATSTEERAIAGSALFHSIDFDAGTNITDGVTGVEARARAAATAVRALQPLARRTAP